MPKTEFEKGFLKLIGQNIKKHRSLKNITQAKLAFAIDMHPAYITEIERGNANVSATNLIKIMIALDIDLSHLFDGIDKITVNSKFRIF